MASKTTLKRGAEQKGSGDEHLSGPARKLLRAADELFFTKGAVATSVREITEACGVTPGALYNHFTSKEDLLFRLVIKRHTWLEEKLQEAVSSAPEDPVSQLTAVVRVYVRVHVAGAEGSMVANREYVHLTGERLSAVVAVRRRLRDTAVGIVRRGADEGVFHVSGGSSRPSVLLAATTVLEMCVHAAEWLRRDGTLSQTDIEDRFVEMALRLLGAETGRPE